MSLQIMIILAVVIVFPILCYMGYRWYESIQTAKDDSTKTDLLSTSAISDNYVPPTASAGQSRVTLSNDTAVSLANQIKGCINFFSADDVTTILSVLYSNISTKDDLAYITNGCSTLGVNIQDVLKKGLDVSQVTKFTSWENSLPDFVPYLTTLK